VEPNPESDGVGSASSSTASTSSNSLACKGQDSAPQSISADTPRDPSVTVAAGIPPRQEDVSRLSREEIARIVMGGFQGSITKHRTSGWYRLARWLALAQCLLAPLLPVTLFVIFGFTCDVLDGDNNTVARKLLEATIAFFVLEAVFSALFFFVFALKYLADRRSWRRYSRKVTPEEEPLLWAFIIRIADTVGAPRPSQIEFDCRTNASAAKVLEGPGFHTNQNALGIGLPLASGMTVEQLAGVIAHELGHFSQKGARGFLFWLDLSISELFGYAEWRQRFDRNLLEFARCFNGRNNRLRWFFIPLSVLVFRSVYLMGWIPCQVHHFWRRQCEYDADQYEVRLTGSRIFEQTTKRFAALWCAFEKAFDDAKRFRHEGRLPDNFPMVFDAALQSLHPNEQEKAEKNLLQAKAKKGDLHPSPSDRIAAATRTQTTGVYRCDLPASVLLVGGQDSARDATLEFYRQHFDTSVSAAELSPADALVAERDKERMTRNVAIEFGLGADPTNRPPPVMSLRLATSSPQTVSLSALIKEIELARSAMQESAASYDSTFEKWQGSNHDIWAGTTAELMLKERAKHLAEPLTEFQDKPQLANERKEAGEAQAEQLSKVLLQFEAGAAQRWHKAVEVLTHRDIKSRLPDATEKFEQAKDMMYLLAGMYSSHGQRINLFHHIGTTVMFLEVKRDTSSTWQTIYERLEHTVAEHESILSHFDGCKYPFAHKRPSLSVPEYLTPIEDMKRISMKVLDGAVEALYAAWDLQWRAAAWMCKLTLEVEAALGLPPLPLVATKKEKSDDRSDVESKAA
jgi:hypothetical protein